MLIVEDDVTSGSALRAILTRKGCEVDHALTLEDGRRLLDRGPDVIILDLMLPDGDGVDILRRVRAAGLGAKVAVTTALSDPQRLAEIYAMNPTCLLRKPIDLVDLLRAIGMM